jgi:hypothetical protein
VSYMDSVLFDEDDFEVVGVDAYGILVKAAWGEQSFVSSWHLVDERKIQLTRRTKPADWDAEKEAREQAVEGKGSAV